MSGEIRFHGENIYPDPIEDPEVILFDEPTSALDPISTAKVEDLMKELKKNFTIVLVTHSREQAKRLSDKIVFFVNGEIEEQGPPTQLFKNPLSPKTKNYLSTKRL
ncbi:unnamed protein product [Didymodactylos carnosus]|uniref:Uncharacterized protein n=1 Tax=Didymodactylos carnosus TaxID=1234261 RepID=A0A8S2NHU7_9BILA|nr:unnamed protein product [Didymodactylos carnosus]CAF4001914.1 unnamed protein product [Didymodactylos carnosus]